MGQELVLSPCAGLWIYKLIDAGEYNAQATDVITTLIKTITAAHGFCSWGYVILWQLLQVFRSGCTFALCPSHGAVTHCSYKWFFQPERAHTHTHIVYVNYAQLLQVNHRFAIKPTWWASSPQSPSSVPPPLSLHLHNSISLLFFIPYLKLSQAFVSEKQSSNTQKHGKKYQRPLPL